MRALAAGSVVYYFGGIVIAKRNRKAISNTVSHTVPTETHMRWLAETLGHEDALNRIYINLCDSSGTSCTWSSYPFIGYMHWVLCASVDIAWCCFWCCCCCCCRVVIFTFPIFSVSPLSCPSIPNFTQITHIYSVTRKWFLARKHALFTHSKAVAATTAYGYEPTRLPKRDIRSFPIIIVWFMWLWVSSRICRTRCSPWRLRIK